MNLLSKLLSQIIKVDSRTASFIAIIIAMSAIFFTYRESKGLEYKDLVVEYKEQLESFKTALEDCITSSEILSEQTYEIRIEEARRMQYKYTSFFPVFVKKVYHPSKDPIMIHVNDSYISSWINPLNKEPEDYIGKTDKEFWGKTLGEIFLRLDQMVIQTKAGIDTDIQDPITKRKLRVTLSPVLYKGEVVQINGEVIFPRKT